MTYNPNLADRFNKKVELEEKLKARRGIKEQIVEPAIQETTTAEDRSGFIYVPSIKLYLAKERTHLGLDWDQTHEALKKENLRMPNPIEFVQFLKYLKDNPSQENTRVYNKITQVRSPWRAEYLDAYFEQRDDGIYVLTGNKKNAEKMDEATLMENRTPGISLDGWLKNPTSQVLTRKNV